MKKPGIKPEFTSVDRILEITGWALLIIFWTLAIKYYLTLPGTIPTHFNIKGEADDYGNKISILALPGLATVLYGGLTLLNRYPHLFNYAVAITDENALRQYTNATQMIRVLKLVLVIIFMVLVTQINASASGRTAGLGVWVLPLIMAMVFIPIVYYIVQSFRLR